MNTKTIDSLLQMPRDVATLNDEWAKLVHLASEQYSTLVEQIKNCQMYCSNISASITEVCVKEE